MNILQPPTWPTPRGYSNGISVRGTQIFVGGQIGWNEKEEFVSTDFIGQVRQALQNIVSVLAQGGAGPEHIVRMTWYIVDKQEYLASLKSLGSAYRDIIGKNYPAMSAIEVKGLMEDKARVEIEVTAVIPD
jgi:enamine deaminase RidA (YjgF/YER057c/UK114 family)